MYSRLGVLRRRAKDPPLSHGVQNLPGELKLEGVNRAWWALSGKKSTSKRQPSSGGKDMEIDSVAGKQPVRGPSPPPGILRKSPEDQEKKQDRPLGHRGLWSDAEFGDE